ncbi:GntR family transcriptional regulator [Carnobacterium gallinarum]|uniref:GntR family transcriptional regulator n=1 Tax=Carnobacterium gallinarum TaxID=2749 RepID=UPI0005578D8D|nr:GntR family transcriptional regulator [Carnobacterium gallinarum]
MKKEPLYQIIYDHLKNDIINQRYPYGAQVPTEKELTASYQVSRITAKRALTELENDGLIERTPGKGSFVTYQNHSTKQTYEIAFMLPFSQAAGLEYYVQGASDYLETTPYQLTIHSTEGNRQRQRELLTNLTKDKWDGLIIYPESPGNSIDLLYHLHLDGFPLVMLDKKLEGTKIPSVTSDNFTGGVLGTNYVMEMGHKKIAYLSTVDLLENSSVRDRYLGYLKALHDHQVQDYSSSLNKNQFLHSHNSEDIQEYLLEVKRAGITCIIAENDVIALSLLAEAKKIKLAIPEELSLIGFDNIQMTDLVSPQLTTIEQNFYQIGYLAAESLVTQINQQTNTGKNFSKTVPVSLIKRESVQKK